MPGDLGDRPFGRNSRSIKEECLAKMIFVGQASLRRAITEYMTHFHAERNHQGLGNRLIRDNRGLPRMTTSSIDVGALVECSTIITERQHKDFGRDFGYYGFVRSMKDECLNRMIFVGQGSLRRAIGEYIAHYHRERNHQGLGNRLIQATIAIANDGEIDRRKRLGGMLNFYYR